MSLLPCDSLIGSMWSIHGCGQGGGSKPGTKPSEAGKEAAEGGVPVCVHPSIADTAVSSWGPEKFPFELIRYSGANRMKVEIDYQAEDGRWGPRRVEPYSLRRTKDGDLLLFVVNDRGQLRGYRVDRIAGVRPTDETFRPRFLVEF